MLGRQLAHYRIRRKLGAGGMGEVWEAEDTRLERSVALKLLPEELVSDPARLSRFRREALSQAALDHPNIVPLYGVEEADGVHFLVMPLVEGETLDAALPEGGFPTGRLLELADALVQALAAAHEKGITHRDLKPGNVMIGRDGRLRVLDFGLARKDPVEDGAKSAEGPTATLTSFGEVVGTLPYMSPEQAQGKVVDARSDVFSLGAVLYEMATGARPFQGTSALDLASAILRDEPADPRTARPDVPEGFWRIIERCLAKKPENRYPSAREIVSEISALRSQAPSASTAAAATSERPLWRRPAPAVLTGMAALTVMVLLLVVLFAGVGDEVEPEPAAAAASETLVSVLPFENLGPAERGYFAAGMTEEITNRLAGVTGLAIVPIGGDSAQGEPVDVGRRLGTDFVLSGSVDWDGGREGSSRVRIRPRLTKVSDGSIAWAEVYERVLQDVFEVQTEIAMDVLDSLGVALLASDDVSERGRTTDNLEAYNYYLQGVEYLNRVQETFSDEDLDLAVDMFRKATAGDPGFALAIAREAYAHALAYFRFFDRSAERLRTAETLARRSLELNPNLPEGHLALGFVHRSELRYDAAMAELEIARHGRPNDSNVIQILGELRWYMGDEDEAVQLYTRAIEIDPRRGELHCSLGGVYMTMGDAEGSERSHARAIDLRPDRACPYWCLGNTYLEEAGDTAKARSYFESLPQELNRDDWPPINYTLALLDVMDGDPERALERLDEGPAEVYEFEQFFIPKAQVRGEVLSLLGRDAEARSSFAAALEQADRGLSDRPDDARIRSARGIALAGLGRFDEAIEEAREATRLMPLSEDVYSGPYRVKDLAQVLMMSGDVEGAVAEIERLFLTPSQIRIYEILLNPIWKPVQQHPRIRELAAQRSARSA